MPAVSFGDHEDRRLEASSAAVSTATAQTLDGPTTASQLGHHPSRLVGYVGNTYYGAYSYQTAIEIQ